MNVKITKRILTGALALTLALAPSVGAYATDITTDGNTDITTDGNTDITYDGTVSGNVTTGTVVSTVTSATEVFKEVKSTSSVAGVESTVSGAFILQKDIAAAITTPATTIAQSFNLGAGERPYVKVFDMDVKKSNLAAASLEIAAKAFGGTNVGFIQMEIGKMANGEYSLLPAGPNVAASFSIPKNAQVAGARYAVIRVVEGGAFTLLEDTDDNPATVSFVTTGGAGAYAIVRF